MNQAQKGVIILIKSAITGEKLQLPKDFDLEKEYSIIKRHHIHAMIYEGASKCGIDQNTPVMLNLFKSYLKSLQVSQRQMKALKIILDLFDKNGIEYLPVKGCLMKELYPKPELRTMGDADVLIRMEQYEKIALILKSNGFFEGGEGKKHITWKSDALQLELHKSLFSPMEHTCINYFGNGWRHALCDHAGAYKMDDEHTFAFLFAHFANHYASEGIGCRHIVDLWVYLKTHPKMNEKSVLEIFRKIGLEKFYLNIRAMIAVWFEGEPSDEMTDFLTQSIFENGSWGFAKNRMLQESARDMGKTNSVFVSKIRYIFRCVFPGREQIQKQYPAASRYPWLLPVMWLVRLVIKLFTIGSVIKKHKIRIALIDESEIKKRKAILEYVGLLDK